MGMIPLLLGLACADPRSRPLPQSPADSAEAAPAVSVSHERELRGVWVATVYNINFPHTRGAEDQIAELTAMVDLLAGLGFNTIVFQARPEGDALYASPIEPWSRSLTGTQGEDPGYDPLQTLIDLARARGLEVHAWLNPYRGAVNGASPLAEGHLCLERPSACVAYGTHLWMDPGDPAVRARTVAVVEDLITRYDLDGLHFDDYFYPYPDGSPFPDEASHAAWGQGQGLADWRRDNVHALIEDVAEVIAARAPHVRFGVAPFGIYRPGQPPGTTGMDQFDAIYSDPLVWLAQGWLDHIAPQLYWPSSASGQPYDALADWWSAQAAATAWTFPGHALYQLGSSATWSVDELRTQLAMTRSHRDQGAMGDLWYHIGPLEADTLGVASVFRDELYATPAWPPPARAVALNEPAAPTVSVSDGVARPTHPEVVRAWALYREEAGAWALERLIPGVEDEIVLGEGRYALSAIVRGGAEGPATLLQP